MEVYELPSPARSSIAYYEFMNTTGACSPTAPSLFKISEWETLSRQGGRSASAGGIEVLQ